MQFEMAVEKQIPCGDDRQKGKGKSKDKGKSKGKARQGKARQGKARQGKARACVIRIGAALRLCDFWG
jgi:hypothetical protein